jgi:hypothetical protein
MSKCYYTGIDAHEMYLFGYCDGDCSECDGLFAVGTDAETPGATAEPAAAETAVTDKQRSI